MPLTKIDESLIVAAYFRGGSTSDEIWTSNCDQVVTLSLFYTGDISFAECERRFSRRSYVGGVYDEHGELDATIESRYRTLIELKTIHDDLIEGAGN